MTTRADLERRLEEATATLEAARRELEDWEPDPDDYREQYDEELRELYGPGILGGYDPARVLRLIDPTAYRCGLLDYVDAYRDELPRPAELTEALEEAEDAVSEAEYELDAFEDDDQDDDEDQGGAE